MTSSATNLALPSEAVLRELLKKQTRRRETKEPADIDKITDVQKNPSMKQMVDLPLETVLTLDPSSFFPPSTPLSPLSPSSPISSSPSLPPPHSSPFDFNPLSVTRARPTYAYMGPLNGYIQLFAFSDNKGSYDWVGLYKNQSDTINDHVSWQWVSRLPYTTNIYVASGYHVRYYRWFYAGYFELYKSSNLDLLGEVNREGERALAPGTWVEANNRGYITMHWSSTQAFQNYDWIGLYASAKDNDANYKTYQWAYSGTSHVTSYAYAPNYHTRFFRYINGRYVVIRYSKPIAVAWLDLNTIYYEATSTTSSAPSSSNNNLQLITAPQVNYLEIIQDQMSKLIKAEPSIFSPGFWPFPDNLIWKNLSQQEVSVILLRLRPQNYLVVILIYYQTYRLAIEIADDSERNAKRHAFWQITLAKHFGEDFAKELGEAHEVGRPGTDRDYEVDEFNNIVAIRYWREHKKVDPLTAANHLWSSGQLRGYSDGVQAARDEFDTDMRDEL